MPLRSLHALRSLHRSRAPHLAPRRIAATITMGLAAALLLGQLPADATQSSSPARGSRADLDARSGHSARFATHDKTGALRFFGTKPGHAAGRPSEISASEGAAAAASKWMDRFGGLFGVGNAGRDLTVKRAATAGHRSIVRMQQRVQGLPVVAGELVVALDEDNNLVSVNGETTPAQTASTDPALSAQTAAAIAVRRVQRSTAARALSASAPVLSVLDQALLGGAPSAFGPATVWSTTVSSADRMVRHEVFVEANRGGVLLDIDANPKAGKDRLICTASDVRTSDPSCRGGTGNAPGITTVATETSPPASTGDSDVFNAFRFSGAVYDFYSELFGRDAIDGAGGKIASTVHFCPPASSNDPNSPACPNYRNAFWDGAEMVYGDGFSGALDVVGHELTHGVTERLSNLFYYYQSGSIDEALSDIMGELIQQLYGPALNDSSGTDVYNPADVWKVGEKLPPGSGTRTLSNPAGELPPRPDAMTSSYYSAKTPWQSGFDNGGVHTNSGVASRAAYLIATGVAGADQVERNVKVANLFYKVDALLTPGSAYSDLYSLLPAACDLVVVQGTLALPLSSGSATTAMTAADCTVVRNAVASTAMNVTALSTNARVPAQAAVCTGAGLPTNVRPVQNFDGTSNPIGNGWLRGKSTAADSNGLQAFGQWWWSKQALTDYGQPLPIPTFTHSGTGALYGDDADPTAVDPNGTTFNRQDSFIRIATPIPARVGTFVRFNHAYEFDYGPVSSTNPTVYNYDGGRVEYTTDGGVNWLDARALFSGGGPAASIKNTDGVFGAGYIDPNPLKGKVGFAGSSHGWTSSRIDLSSLNGKSVLLRWRIGGDDAVGSLGWYVDDVTTYSCNPTAILVTAPKAIPYGGAFTLKARLVRTGTTAGLASQTLQLFSHAHGATGTYTAVLPVKTTDSNGYASWALKPAVNYDYSIRFATTTPFAGSSRGWSVLVTPKILRTVSPTSITLGHSFIARGTISPARGGKRIYLQRYGTSGWSSIASALISTSGAYALAYKPPARGSATYRVAYLGDTQYGPASSLTFVVKVA